MLRRPTLQVATFIVLVALSLSNLFAWPAALSGYRSFAGYSLVNAVLNGSFNRPMDPMIAPAYLMITTPANYVASLAMRLRPRWKAIALFAALYIVVSGAVSVASLGLYLVGEQGRLPLS